MCINHQPQLTISPYARLKMALEEEERVVYGRPNVKKYKEASISCSGTRSSQLISHSKEHTPAMIRPSALLAILTVATTSYAQLASVSADLHSIATQVTSLDNELKAFPTSGGNLVSALATGLASALAAAATAATNTGPVTEAEAQGILAIVEGFEPTILDSLTEIVAKKPGFDSLPLGGVSALVAQDLATLKTDTKNFENALVADTPADLLATAASLTSAIDAALATASAAYN
ncbi:hypothetical protein D9757_001351 [Collybiopsis confluens]|uniref:Hydrophobic surface binding protein n=1 Tax=Collybiopsis confluens TaxID=2823264 RepID=A0A8H5MG33_9AGAR|nr:hypothetical protein D9757_001351 [Collybiopsis confluens]